MLPASMTHEHAHTAAGGASACREQSIEKPYGNRTDTAREARQNEDAAARGKEE